MVTFKIRCILDLRAKSESLTQKVGYIRNVVLYDVSLEEVVHHADQFVHIQLPVVITVKQTHLLLLSSTGAQSIVRVNIPILHPSAMVAGETAEGGAFFHHSIIADTDNG